MAAVGDRRHLLIAMKIEKLITRKNLRLAWRRITSSSDARYKAFFRPMLEAYEISYEKNLEDLRQRIKNRAYDPQSPIRFYVPKPSGLQRPLTLLHLEDQIVYQALTNLFAEKIREKRAKLVYESTYSNVLGKVDSPFFLEKWQKGYSRLKRNIKSKFKGGYTWIAVFDISAFYDTIPHQLLLKVLVPSQKGSLFEETQTWLKTWSTDKTTDHHNHGIPQGPMASDFLAECILLDIDEKMSAKYAYYRYVDDVRILGKTELEVRQALVELDILCKSKGPIPNSDKTKIRQVTSAEELVTDIPDVAMYFDDGGGQAISKKKAEEQILKAIDKNNSIIIKNRTLFRYVLFRSPASDEILRIIIEVWEHYPEHTEAIVAYLENYQRSDEIIKLATHLLNINYPYDYVRGELWRLIARMGTINELLSLKKLAINAIKNSSSGYASRVGAQVFLCRCDEMGLGKYGKWLMFEDRALVQAIVAPYLNLNSNSGKEAGKAFLSRSTVDSYLGLVNQIIKTNTNLSAYERNPAEFPMVAQYVYKTAGLSGHQIFPADAIGNLLSKRYDVQKWRKWKKLLKLEYEHAYNMLQYANAHYESFIATSTWLNFQDTFNEILFKAFQEFLISKNAPGAVKLTNKKGNQIKYGVLLNNTNFKSIYPDLQGDLNKIHRRRNRLPSSHAYDERTGDKAKPLKKDEQQKLKLYIEDALKEIIRIVEALGI